MSAGWAIVTGLAVLTAMCLVVAAMEWRETADDSEELAEWWESLGAEHRAEKAALATKTPDEMEESTDE